MGGSGRDFRGPNGSVGKYWNCAVFLITARTLADSCACLCLGGSCENSPSTVGVICGLGKGYLHCAVILGGVNFLTLCKVGRSGRDLRGPNSSVGKYGDLDCLGHAAGTRLLCLALGCFRRLSL